MYRSPTWWRAALVAGGAIVAFDAVASIISRMTGFDYTNFAYGSYLIQAAAGFFGRRSGLSFWGATLLGTWVGLVEATAGWAVSWWIGPGRVEGPVATEVLIGIVLYVAIGATVLGALGSIVGGFTRASERRRQA
jgi:hypothetical protein